MKQKKHILTNIIKNFKGLSKVEAYELVHQVETVLFYAKAPLSEKNLNHIIESKLNTEHEIDPFYFTILSNGNFCEFIGSNSWIHLYKENKKFLPNWPIFTTYYFKTKYAPLELLKLNEKNLLENVRNTDKAIEVFEFLSENKITKINRTTNELQLLQV